MNAEQHTAVAGKVHELKRKDEEILLARQDAAKQAKLKDLQVDMPPTSPLSPLSPPSPLSPLSPLSSQLSLPVSPPVSPPAVSPTSPPISSHLLPFPLALQMKKTKVVEDDNVELKKVQESLRGQAAQLEREIDFEKKEQVVLPLPLTMLSPPTSASPLSLAPLAPLAPLSPLSPLTRSLVSHPISPLTPRPPLRLIWKQVGDRRAATDILKELEELDTMLGKTQDATQRQADIVKLNLSMIKQLEGEIQLYKVPPPLTPLPPRPLSLSPHLYLCATSLSHPPSPTLSLPHPFSPVHP